MTVEHDGAVSSGVGKRCRQIEKGLWGVLMERGRLTEDEELLGWERGCLGVAELLELASSYRGCHVELW